MFDAAVANADPYAAVIKHLSDVSLGGVVVDRHELLRIKLFTVFTTPASETA